jgi:hypothetical protein
MWVEQERRRKRRRSFFESQIHVPRVPFAALPPFVYDFIIA